VSNESTLSWVRGLSAYLEFDNDLESKKFIDFLEQAMYAENPVIDTTNQSGMIEFISVLRKFASNPIFDVFHKYYRAGYDPLALQDAFSRGQVLSKIWLAEELSKIEQKEFPTVFLLAGWFGQAVKYLDKTGIQYKRIRNFDIDPIACEVSDKVFNIKKIDGFEVKSVEMDINNLERLYKTGLEFTIKNYTNGHEHSEKRFPSLVVNTSAEHFNEDWYHKFVIRTQESDPLYIIQSNNLFDVEEHVNCVHSVEEMLVKFPMTRIEYAGEKELFGYKRFMLIGRP
jgi:hypothetical protein